MQSIPYDPALALADIVQPSLLAAVQEISRAGAPIDAAQEELDALILAKRSLDMTINELTGMGIDPTAMLQASSELGKRVSDASVNLAMVTIACQDKILRVKEGRASIPVSKSVESPLVFQKIAITSLPLSADSIKMDAQYFANDSNTQDSSSTAGTVASISSYVASSTAFLGHSRSNEMRSAAQSQVSGQYQKHDVSGTLVITCGCTHKGAQMIAPLIIDPDKAIQVWNTLYPLDTIRPNDRAAIVKIAQQESEEEEASFEILSGATYGSSFVGMVHILDTTTTRSSESALAAMASMQNTMTTGAWFAGTSGGFGVDSTFASDVKKMLSMQQITSHCSVVCMGVIPSVKSSSVALAVKQLTDDRGASMQRLVTLQNALGEASSQQSKSVAASADAARAGNQMMQIQSSTIQAVISALSSLDDGQSPMLDVNALMTVFEDYLNKVGSGGPAGVGVPITYYLKSITKAQLCQLWVAKYYPRYLAISGDDSDTASDAKQENAT